MKRKEHEGFNFFKADLLKISPGTKKVINGVEISRGVSFPNEFHFRIILEDKKSSFEEQFPSLKGKVFCASCEKTYGYCECGLTWWVIKKELIQKCCVDRQRLKDIIEEFSHTVFSFKPSNLEEAYEQHNANRDIMVKSFIKLKQDLGLE